MKDDVLYFELHMDRVVLKLSFFESLGVKTSNKLVQGDDGDDDDIDQKLMINILIEKNCLFDLQKKGQRCALPAI